jgi:hypothetical protein
MSSPEEEDEFSETDEPPIVIGFLAAGGRRRLPSTDPGRFAGSVQR